MTPDKDIQEAISQIIDKMDIAIQKARNREKELADFFWHDEQRKTNTAYADKLALWKETTIIRDCLELQRGQFAQSMERLLNHIEKKKS